ncbi:MAG: type II toxin-antitoxin system VapC family toxin [Akkermansiaceae bacterium]|nr:type II toxin-antitoxin system VapC family toxin [Akkermansiaceae bacterium]
MAERLVKLLQLPEKARLDAAHLSMPIIHRMDYLLTWNCTHLANPVLQKILLEYCNYHSLHVPVICTPEHLIIL